MSSARVLIPGIASGRIVYSDIPLSFMMGVDPDTGTVVDQHHPLNGTSLVGCILAIPSGRGSCSASGAILELLLKGIAPAALIFHKTEDILTLGVQIARVMFAKSIPVLVIENLNDFNNLATVDFATITSNAVSIGSNKNLEISLSSPRVDRVNLSPNDQAMLAGNCGSALKIAMEMIVFYATIQGAESLIDISQAHIDACIYVGDSSVLIPERLASIDGKFAVPTTCNSLSVDRLRWQELGADPSVSKAASKIGDLYLKMGAKLSFTCAPYLLEDKPAAGDQIGWAESNAVVFANSVLGARTQKYPDYMDVFIALAGRAPLTGCHLALGRVPGMMIEVPEINGPDESIFPLVGYHIGEIIGTQIPLISGLETYNATISALKAFGAGFATSSSVAMFHMKGVTPEASNFGDIEEQLPVVRIHIDDLARTWTQLNTATDCAVDLVSLGNPHLSVEEFKQLAELCQGRHRAESTQMMITTSRDTYSRAAALGYIDVLERFGATIITDTCWCMIVEPVIPVQAGNIMTNSSKYAHYGPGSVKRKFHFGCLASCVQAACAGHRDQQDLTPSWLFPGARES